ncbi:hypothetical protein [Wenyingzhuangia sp. IMCC45467]
MLLFTKLYFLQIPSEIPHPDHNKALDFSNPMEIIFYIGAPILILIVFIWLKRKKGNQ